MSELYPQRVCDIRKAAKPPTAVRLPQAEARDMELAPTRKRGFLFRAVRSKIKGMDF